MKKFILILIVIITSLYCNAGYNGVYSEAYGTFGNNPVFNQNIVQIGNDDFGTFRFSYDMTSSDPNTKYTKGECIVTITWRLPIAGYPWQQETKKVKYTGGTQMCDNLYFQYSNGVISID